MFSAKQFRNLIDESLETKNFSKVIEQMSLISQTVMDTEYGNSFIHALALLDNQYIEFEEWVGFFNLVNTNFSSKKFDKSTYHSMMRLFCSDYGHQHLETTEGFHSSVSYLLHTMLVKNITLRRRTLSPIIRVAYTQKIDGLGMSIYAMAKYHQIKLDTPDMAYLLSTADELQKFTLLQDINSNYKEFNKEAIDILVDNFTSCQYQIDANFRCGTFQVPEYRLSREERKSIMYNLSEYVDNRIKHKKATRSAYKSFCSSIPRDVSIVLDAANVARYQQGEHSDKALNTQHYQQIKKVVSTLVKQGQKVLICLNETHYQKLSSKNKVIYQEIEQLARIKLTPIGMDDDLCWLYAAIAIPFAKLVTTDKLRDHIYAIDPRIEQWKEYQRVSFDISRDTGEVTFKYPRGYEVKPHLVKARGKVMADKIWIPSSPTDWFEFIL